MRRILPEIRRSAAERRIIRALRNTAVSIRVTQNSARKKEVKIQHGSRIRALAIILSESGSDRPKLRRRQSRKRR